MATPLAFLNSDAASYLSGTNRGLDNGFTAALTVGELPLGIAPTAL